MPRPTPEGRLDQRLTGIASAAERNVLAAFRGVDPADIVAVWPELSPPIRSAILDAQGASLAAVGDYLGALVDGFVPVDAEPWLGRMGAQTVDEFLDVTPRAHASRLAKGMSDAEAAVATANRLATSAGTEPHRIGRGAVATTATNDFRFTGWKRVPEAGACDFCRMLASRGAVYDGRNVRTNEDGSKYLVQLNNALRYHLGCKCRAVAMAKGAGVETWDGKGALTGNPVGRPQGSKTTPRAVVPEAPKAPAPPIVEAIPAAPRFTAESAQALKNADLDDELTAAYNTSDDALADVLEAEMDRRQKWADGWGRQYDEYDDFRPLDATELDDLDLPDFEDIPQPVVSRRAARAEWDAEQEIRRVDAEAYGGGVHPDLAAEARSKGITLDTLMSGDPRTAYKYANQELLQWWSTNGGRKPFYEIEAVHGRLDSTKLARARLTEDKARTRAERLLGKNRAEGVARLDRERRAAKAARR